MEVTLEFGAIVSSLRLSQQEIDWNVKLAIL